MQRGIGLTVGRGAVSQDALHHRDEHGREHGTDHLPLQRFLVGTEGLLGGVQLAHHAGHGPQQRIPFLLEPLPQGGIKMLVLLLAQALALHQRVERQASLFVHVEVEALLACRLVHLLDEARTHGLKAILQFGTLFHVILVVEAGGKLLADVGQRLRQGRAQLPALSRRDGKQQGAVRIVEVVDVDEIRWRRRLADARLKELAQHVGSSEIGLARKVDVVARRMDMQGQLKRLERAGLRRHLAVAVAGDGVARLPGDAVRGQIGTETLARQRFDFAHGFPA